MMSEPLTYDVELTPVQTKIAPPTAPLFPDQRWSNLILIPSPQELDTSEKTLRSCKRTTTNVQQAKSQVCPTFVVANIGMSIAQDRLTIGDPKEKDWILNVIYESWYNNPHLKRGEELEIKFITIASEDTTNVIKYPSFHFMKLQKPDMKAFTYIREQEMKPELVVSLMEDEISTRRAWGIWVCLTEMDKVKYPFKIYQNSVNGSFLLNSMTGSTTRFANDMFDGKTS
ncbi:hypothetical protein ACS0TY_031187 [Phlomoides rotata]